MQLMRIRVNPVLADLRLAQLFHPFRTAMMNSRRFSSRASAGPEAEESFSGYWSNRVLFTSSLGCREFNCECTIALAVWKEFYAGNQT